MKYVAYLALILLMQVAAATHRPLQRLQRLPLQKKSLIFKSPATYEKRILRYNQAGEPIYYDPKPQVKLLDAKSGKYAFRWIGYDGQEKTVIFQRADAIDAVVSASVLRMDSGQYLYTYNIKNLQSSGERLAGFAVQTFASHVKPIEIKDIHLGHMSESILEFKDGHWIRFAPLSSFKDTIIAGRSVEFRLESSATPGLVGCRIHGGELGLKGVGEDMPQELENILPGYRDWPEGYTIGPVDNLKNLSLAGRAEYVLKLLPQFERLGWMTSGARQRYMEKLQRKNLSEVYNRAEQDLKNGSITTEVHDMIQALLGR